MYVVKSINIKMENYQQSHFFYFIKDYLIFYLIISLNYKFKFDVIIKIINYK